MATAQGESTDVIPCGGYGYDFDVRLDVAYKLKFIVFFDRQGDPSTLHVQVSNRETFTNTEPGLSVTATDAGVDIVDLKSGTVSIIGVLVRITVPGKGALVLDVGKITFDADDNLLFVAGPHQVFFGDDGLICAALA